MRVPFGHYLDYDHHFHNEGLFSAIFASQLVKYTKWSSLTNRKARVVAYPIAKPLLLVFVITNVFSIFFGTTFDQWSIVEVYKCDLDGESQV